MIRSNFHKDMANPGPMAQLAPNEPNRDLYGFAILPHHIKLYRQFAEIYKEEEAERSIRWEQFLKTYGDTLDISSFSESNNERALCGGMKAEVGCIKEKDYLRNNETWCHVRPGLEAVQRAMQHRLKKFHATQSNGHIGANVFEVKPYDASSPTRYASEKSADDSDDEFYDAERSDAVADGLQSSVEALTGNCNHSQDHCPWVEELDALVRGGVPMALRGEVWQVFVGSSPHRMHGHYEALLTLLADGGFDGNGSRGLHNDKHSDFKIGDFGILEKWTNQIEKDIPRTFPGHPALDEDGRNALRRILTAYARHNPDVGYCQAMNFFAGLLLLMMPEENAFWTLTGILNDCFEGYYIDNMLESQVDQLVLEELVRQHLPRLMSHLEGLGVQLAWITGPWFLSIFIHVLPWESVLRIWDVLLFEGNRSMLFKTTLAVLELHGPAIMSTKDAGDAMTKLQSLVRATFDSSLLVLTACVGYQSVHESRLQELRQKHRSDVLGKLTDRITDQSVWHKSFGPMAFSSKFSRFDKTLSVISNADSQKRSGESSPIQQNGGSNVVSSDGYGSSADEKVALSIRGLEEGTMLADFVNEVKYLKLELSKALEERRVANIRADELETAFMELVKEDNRRLLTAKVETLQAEAASLKEAVAFKVEQEQAMVQVMVRMEHEQRVAEDARRLAEEDAEKQQITLHVLQAKYESIVSSLKELENRVEAAEGRLEATANRSHDGTEHSRWSSWTWSTPK